MSLRERMAMDTLHIDGNNIIVQSIPPSKKSNAFLSLVQKFNENHDELGRFAESDGSGSGSSGDHASGDSAASGASTHFPAGKLSSGTFGLTPAAQNVVDNRMAKDGITHDMLVNEIDATIGGKNSDLMQEGAKWYPEAHDAAEAIGSRYGVTTDRAVAVIAAMSPQQPWNENLRLADEIMSFHKSGDYTSSQTEPLEFMMTSVGRTGLVSSANVSKAFAVLNGKGIDQTLGGTKVRSFFNNILEPGKTNDVTIDTHMAKLFQRVKPDLTDKGVASLLKAGSVKAGQQVGSVGIVAATSAVRQVAKKYGLPPDTVQAAYWLGVR